MRNQSGQSLIELVVALGIFVIVISVLVFLILNSYVAGRLASEITQANFLAEEGLEAARSIRDNNWQDLTNGDHGLIISGGNWQFSGTSETIDGKFTRVITVEEIDPDRKKITSKISWQFTETRPQEVQLITYLTNWQKILAEFCTGTPTPCNQFLDQGTCLSQDGCSWTPAYCGGICTPCSEFQNRTTCQAQAGCSWRRAGRVWQCIGTCTPCENFVDQISCQGQLACSWNPEICGGTPLACENYTTEAECVAQSGCQWVKP